MSTVAVRAQADIHRETDETNELDEQLRAARERLETSQTELHVHEDYI